MTLGEKLAALRGTARISQEQLAEQLGVSRQSVSKWEMDQTVPQLENILTICDIFRITADAMLRPELPLFGDVPGRRSAINAPAEGLKYFGTDGFRGETNVTLTTDQAYRVGRFIGWYVASPLSGFHEANYRPRILIGKDTRRSSYTLEYALVAGLTASGADVYMLHVTTTPSVSYITRQDDFDCGIMITASHNPYYDNGIKLINRYGEKMDDATLQLVERYLDGDLSALGIVGEELPLAHREWIGQIVDFTAGRNRYMGYLISLAAHSYRHLRIGLDCANGASWMIARAVFEALGAKTYVIGNAPDGLNVNSGCGSTHLEALCQLVREQHLDVGFAFDGDADRCLAVDENGTPVDGDRILYILAHRLAAHGMLDGNTVVATVMSNSGLLHALTREGMRCEVTGVGDRLVYECMEQHGYRLGGEQSGHIILRKNATTGDGLLTAIMLAEQMCECKAPLSALSASLTLYPQLTRSLRVRDKAAVTADPAVRATVKRLEAEIGGEGRILLRESGTEPVVRVMVECAPAERCQSYVERVCEAIRKGGHCCE